MQESELDENNLESDNSAASVIAIVSETWVVFTVEYQLKTYSHYIT